MTLAQLLAFNVTLLVAMFSPGPALLVAVQTNLTAGRPRFSARWDFGSCSAAEGEPVRAFARCSRQRGTIPQDGDPEWSRNDCHYSV